MGYASRRNLSWIAIAVGLMAWGAGPPGRPESTSVLDEAEYDDDLPVNPNLPCADEARLGTEVLLNQISPVVTTLNRYIKVQIEEVPRGFQPDGGYLTKHGLDIDPSCFTKTSDGKDRRELAKQYDETDQALFDGVDRCGKSRMLSTAEMRFRRAIRQGVHIKCDPKGCTGPAEACRSKDGKWVNFSTEHVRRLPGIWFHEILHFARGVDNQAVPEHNVHSPESDLKDEVVFWQRHCFAPHQILKLIRDHQPNACSAALAYHPGKPKARYNHTERQLMCGLYSRYLDLENNFLRNAAQTLVPEIFRCEPAAGDKCPDFKKLNAKLQAHPQLERFALPEPGHYRDWLARQCPEVTPNKPDDIRQCLYVYARNVQGALDVEGVVTSTGMTDDEEVEITRYANLLALRSDVVGSAVELERLPIQSQMHNSIPASEPTRLCLAEKRLRGSSVCKAYEASFKRPHAALLRYWW